MKTCKCKTKCNCKNNYQLAIIDGRAVGMTLQEYLDSLEGDNGNPGLRGANNFELWLDDNPGKTIEDFWDFLRGETGASGRSSFTSYVFKRVASGIPPDKPVGGNYLVPRPIDTTWTDGPTGGGGILYMSYRVFTSDGLPPQQVEWAVPVVAADSDFIDFEWSSVELNPGNPTTHPQNWVNEADETSIWMAIRKFTNGAWEPWQVFKIKGEAGDKGDGGDSVEVRYQKNGSFTAPPSLTPSVREPAGWSLTAPTVAVGEYLWMIQAIVNMETNALKTNWSTPIRTTGVRGDKGDQGDTGPAGPTGPNGSNNMIVNAYTRSLNSPPNPTATVTYNFLTKALTGLNNSWTVNAPIDNGLPLWVIAATASSPTNTDTIEPNEWSTPVRIVQSGSNGNDGNNGLNQATIFLYRRTSAISPAPPKPTVDSTYTFATGTITGVNNSWVRTIPQSGDRYKWVIQATAISSGATDVITAAEWSDPVLFVDGEDGETGPSILYRGDWSDTKQYNGNPYAVDFVRYTVNGKGYFARRDVNNIPIGTVPTNTTYWNEAPINVDAVFTDFLVAYSAYIQDLIVGALRTGLSGERVEITPAANAFRFYNSSNELKVEIGNIGGFAGMTIDGTQYTTEGIRNFSLDRALDISFRGIDLQNDQPGAIYATYGNGPTRTVRAKLSARQSQTQFTYSYGLATDTIFVENGIYVIDGTGGTGLPNIVKGFTGTTTPGQALRFKDGVCLGPA